MRRRGAIEPVWDPFGTLKEALWIGGGQWAGKSTVARLLAARYRLTVYHYDYHDARGHDDRRLARRVRRGEPIVQPDPDAMWLGSDPGEMAAQAMADFGLRFEWALDDLRALVSGAPIIAEGWGLRPELVAPIIDSPRRMVVMVPTDAFRHRQIRELERASRISAAVSDPELAQRNRLERDRQITQDVVDSARRHDIRVIEIDGGANADAVTRLVAEHFAPYLDVRSPAA